MCFPLLAATAAISAVSALVSFQGQQANANAQKSQWQMNQVNALAADRDTQNQLTERQLQENGATQQKVQASYLDQARREAEAQASGASSGISGISLDSIVSDVAGRSEANRATLLTNWNNTAQQLQTEKDAANDQYESRVDSVGQGVAPNPLVPVLGVAATGVKYETDSTNAANAAGNAGSGP